MKELSLNILDISQNSVKANATKIDIVVTESIKDDLVTIKIIDNGCGMSTDFLASVIDPFVTTRTTRKVGLGIPLLRQLTIDTQGEFDIKSKLGEGTSVFASFKLSHLDRPPIGDMPSTIVTIISSNPDIRYVYTHKTDIGEFVLDTDEIKETLDGIPISEPEILVWLGGYLTENLNSIEGGNI
jgi:hypothetical protein